MSDKKTETEEKSIETMQKENEALFEQLTNKNSEYMVKLNRKLEETDITEEQKTRIFNDMLTNIVAQQSNHITARRLYGTVTDQAHYLTENPDRQEAEDFERSEPWKLYIDGALLLGGMFSIITGLPYFISSDPTAGLALISLILTFILGGFAVMVITKYAPVPGQKGGFIKYIAATTVAMLTWILLMGFASYAGEHILPAAMNPFIPGPYTIVIGIIALAAKWYVKRELNIKGTLI